MSRTLCLLSRQGLDTKLTLNILQVYKLWKQWAAVITNLELKNNCQGAICKYQFQLPLLRYDGSSAEDRPLGLFLVAQVNMVREKEGVIWVHWGALDYVRDKGGCIVHVE